MNNSTKVWLFILGTSLLLLVLGYELGGRLGLFIGFLLAISLNSLIFFFGETRLLSQMKAYSLKGQDAWGLNDAAEKYAQSLGAPTPQIFLFNSESVTCFCISQSFVNGTIAFSTGLLKRLSPEELNAIIAHQVSQVSRRDSFAFNATSIVANSIVGFGSTLDKYLPFRIFEWLFSPIGWLIIKPTSPAKSFFENDAATVAILDNRFILGKTLWKLEGYAQTIPLEVPPGTSHLFITQPQSFNQKNIFMKMHPPIELRIQKLMGYFPP